MRFSIVIVARNEERDLEGTIVDLCRSYFPPFEVIVVDDMSVEFDGLTVAQRVERLGFPEVRVVRPDTQQGAGKAKRMGCLEAKGDVIIVCDSHLQIPEDHLDKVQEAVETYPDAIFCPVCVGFSGKVIGAGATFNRRSVGFLGRSWASRGPLNEVDKVPCVLGAYYVIPRHIGEAFDWICPLFEGWGQGEQWMSLMAWLMGFEVRRLNDLEVRHRFLRGLTNVLNLSTWHNAWNAAVLLLCIFGPERFRAEIWPGLQGSMPKQQERAFSVQIPAIGEYAEGLRAKFRFESHELLGLCGWRQPTLDEATDILVARAAKHSRCVKAPKPAMGKHHLETILDALPVNGKLLEWGSGGSTLWFRERGIDITSVEHDPEWAKKIDGVIFCEMDVKIACKEEEANPDPTIPYANVGGSYDVILVDGVLRNACLIAARSLLKPNGILFLHDSNRDWYVEGLKGWEVVKEWKACLDYRGPKLLEVIHAVT